MSEASDLDEASPQKKSKIIPILAFIFLAIGAGAGFSAVSAGLISGDHTTTETDEKKGATEGNDRIIPTFMPLDPILITLSTNGQNRLVRFTAQLDINPDYVEEVETLKPRIVDILNGYLRALNVEDLEASNALTKIRSQMLHRVRIVTGKNHINDLLVMELIIN